tara:strand:- start:6358 stop:6708 length:351 start_codon:yes stop_codon:yes gene_type:complete
MQKQESLKTISRVLDRHKKAFKEVIKIMSPEEKIKLLDKLTMDMYHYFSDEKNEDVVRVLIKKLNPKHKMSVSIAMHLAKRDKKYISIYLIEKGFLLKSFKNSKHQMVRDLYLDQV